MKSSLFLASFFTISMSKSSSSLSSKLQGSNRVLVKNIVTSVRRIAKVLALDRPAVIVDETSTSSTQQFLHSHSAMGILPSYIHTSTKAPLLDGNIAYITPILAFNIGLHVLCFNVLVRGGEEHIKSLFHSKENETEKETATSVYIELAPWSEMPRYASHLRISFVKAPECHLLQSLRGSSPVEAEDRQELIDSALNGFFRIDRFLARGDIFCVHINWNCNSEICVACSRKAQKSSANDKIYFKVMAMEPLDEPILRVNCNHTALVLGGAASSPVPPDSLISQTRGFVPLQGDTLKDLASIIMPTLSPSTLLSKFRVSLLLFGPAGCGKRTVVKFIARQLGLHVVEYSCHDLVASSEKKASTALAHTFNTAFRYTPAILLLRHFDVFGKFSSNDGSSSDQVGITSEIASVIREFTEPLAEDEEQLPYYISKDGFTNRHRILLVAASDTSEGLQPSIRRCFSHELSLSPLTESQRVDMLSQLVEGITNGHGPIGETELLKDIVGQTSGFKPRDIRSLVADAGANFVSRLLTPTDKVGSASCTCNGITSPILPILNHDSSCRFATQSFRKEDFSQALERSKKRNASALGTPKVPNVKWEDVGGLEEVKKSILDTVQLPLLHKDLFLSGLRKRSGTLLAKAVATECSLNFLSVKGPELINMYIGESEKNVRDIFEKARSARPCVIFFDELDSLAPARGASGDSGGVMDRVVSQMLAEIDGLSESKQDLFIIGASNRPDLIDPALLRPGRFDKLLYVGVNSDASNKERVLASLTRKFKLHGNVSLSSIAKKCPPNFTGADMYALCTDAWFHAAKRKVLSHSADSSSGINDDPDSVIVELLDFVKALGELAPSLSIAELRKYEQLRYQFEGNGK
ncbi:hypothetical protein Taro_006998 [Colocasia esculenta]|uniref:Peroxisomal ATPase PEX6 n=1 Tax=Colocasia esculenta TaxID=4460 RepID=A0A843TZA3_COLES|nr:hypothetical protein [Colocasia esculenta]